ncbi:response regulator [Nitriliruptor alkaliphilus]|uniref:response regulator n=1 Tax=Nitriliruptor alkaliphilus TaxID=427918 RepID=UPI00147012A2|nr:response regulator [Nitriliruptor alkaliphilus]
MARVLVVDDDPVTLIGLELQLRALGHEVRSRPTLADGLLAAVEERADVLLLDVDLGDGRTGDELLALLDRGVGRPLVTCLLSGSDAGQLAALADRLGAAWLPKPVRPSDLAQVLGRSGRRPDADGEARPS